MDFAVCRITIGSDDKEDVERRVFPTHNIFLTEIFFKYNTERNISKLSKLRTQNISINQLTNHIIIL
jgi:hypothetical protein